MPGRMVRRRPARALLAALVVVALVAAACSSDDDEGAPPDTQSVPASVPVGTAAGGTTATTALPGGDDLFVLSLTSGSWTNGSLTVEPTGSVTVFADRPQRAATTESVEDFVAAWPDRFGDDPPNASISAGTTVAVLELDEPLAVDGGRLQFPARLLSQEAPPAEFGGGSLFVDPSPSDDEGQAVLIDYSIPAGGRIALTWSNGSPTVPFDTFPTAAFVVGATGPAQNPGEVISIYYQLVIGSTGDAANGSIILPFEVQFDGPDVSGSAQLSDGASVQAKTFTTSGDYVTLTDGQPFTLPAS